MGWAFSLSHADATLIKFWDKQKPQSLIVCGAEGLPEGEGHACLQVGLARCLGVQGHAMPILPLPAQTSVLQPTPTP